MIVSDLFAKSTFDALDQIQTGALNVYLPDGSYRSFGSGSLVAHWDVRDMRVFSSLGMRGEVGLGEAYALGWWETPDLEALATVALNNHELFTNRLGGAAFQRFLFNASDRFLRANSKRGSRRNIHAHYDISNVFYGRWLDETMSYSSALFESDGQTLSDAQNTKYDRLLRAAGAEQGDILEIGCGWGGFAERALEKTDCNLTGVTISTEQHDFTRGRLQAAGHDARSDIRLQDYRDIDGRFDAIVSIEMIEAVGMQYWPTYFGTIKDRLAPGGKAALQAIIVEDEIFDHYRTGTDFIRRYTFPGGMLISPSQIRKQAERAGLVADNIFRFGKDYARTLRLWRDRFEANLPEFTDMGMKPEFLRGWKYYLETCAAAFEIGTRTNVVHFELRHA